MSKSKPIQNIDEKAIWDGIKQFARDPRGVSQFLKKDTMGRIGRTVADTVKGAFEPVDRVRAAQSMKTFYDSSKGGEKGIIDVRNPKFFALIKKYFAIGEELGGRFLQDVQSGRLAHSRVNSALNSIQSFFDFLKSRDASNYQNIVSQWTMRDDANEFMRDPSIGIPINVRPRVLNELNLAFARAMRGGANKVMRAAGENWGGEAVTGAEGQFERISAGIDQFATELAERIGQMKERPLSEDELKEINTKIGQAKITLKRFIDLASKSNDPKSIDTIKAAQEKLHKLEDFESDLGKYLESPEERNKSLTEIENYVNVEVTRKTKDILAKVQSLGTKINNAYVTEYKRQLNGINNEFDYIESVLNKYYSTVNTDPNTKAKVDQIKTDIAEQRKSIESVEAEIDRLVGGRSISTYEEQFNLKREQLDRLIKAVPKIQITDGDKLFNARTAAREIKDSIAKIRDEFKQKYPEPDKYGTQGFENEIQRALNDIEELIGDLYDLEKQGKEVKAKNAEEEKTKSSEALKREITNIIEPALKEVSGKISNYKTSRNPAVKKNIESYLNAIDAKISEFIDKVESGSQHEQILNSASDRVQELRDEFKAVLSAHNIQSIENGLRLIDASVDRANERLRDIASNGYSDEDAEAVKNIYTVSKEDIDKLEAEIKKLPTESDEVKSLLSKFDGVRNSIERINRQLSYLGMDDETNKVVREQEPKFTGLINKLTPIEISLKTYSGKLDRRDFAGNVSDDITNKINDAKTNVEAAENLMGEPLSDKAKARLSKKWDKLDALVASVNSLISAVETKRKTAEDGSRDEALANFIRGTEYATGECASVEKLIRDAIDRKAEDPEDYDQVKRLYNAYKRTLDNANDFLNRNYPEWDESGNEKVVTLANNIQVLRDKLKGLKPSFREFYNVRFEKEVVERTLIELEELAKKTKSKEKLKGIYSNADAELRRLGKMLPSKKTGRIDRNMTKQSKKNVEAARERLSDLKRDIATKLAKLEKDEQDKKKNETFDNMISQLLRSAKILESAAPDALDNAINALDQNQPPVDPMQQPMDNQPTDPTMAGAEPPPEPTMDAQAEPQVEVSGLAPDADPRGVELDEPEHKSGEHSTRKVMSAVRKALETEVDQLAMNIARASKWPTKAAKKAIDITSDKSKRDILTKVKANLKGNMDKKLESILQECAILEKKMNKSKAKANAKAKKDTKKKADKKADKKPKKLKECVGSMAKYFESACVLDEAKAKDKKKKSGDSSKFIFGKSDKKKR